MKRKSYTLSNEPKGGEYLQLLTIGLDFCDKAVLITRDQFGPSEKAMDRIRTLTPFEIERKKTAEWPGTKLLGHKATAVTYTYNAEFVAAMKKISNSLFEWLHPDLPEDLCLLRPDDSPWLVTISHEHDACLELSDDEYIPLKSSYPKFALMLSLT